jgi:hypothetical protein
MSPAVYARSMGYFSGIAGWLIVSVALAAPAPIKVKAPAPVKVRVESPLGFVHVPELSRVRRVLSEKELRLPGGQQALLGTTSLDGSLFAEGEPPRWLVWSSFVDDAAAKAGRSRVERALVTSEWKPDRTPGKPFGRWYQNGGGESRCLVSRPRQVVWGHWDQSGAKRSVDAAWSALRANEIYRTLKKDVTSRTLASGYWDIQSMYGRVAQRPTASRDAAVVVRLGLDEFQGMRWSAETPVSGGVALSSKLHYSGKPAGLMEALGKPVRMKIPRAPSPEVASYAAFSVVPSELYWTAFRVAGYLRPLEADLLKGQLRQMGSQLNGLVDVDILGERSQLWELVERERSGGGRVTSLRAGIADPARFRRLMELIVPVVRAFYPNAQLSTLKRDKGVAWSFKGAFGELAVGLEGSAVLVAPDLKELDVWKDSAAWGWKTTPHRARGWGFVRSGVDLAPWWAAVGGSSEVPLASGFLTPFKELRWNFTTSRGAVAVNMVAALRERVAGGHFPQ